jgi:hypothetical protein
MMMAPSWPMRSSKKMSSEGVDVVEEVIATDEDTEPNEITEEIVEEEEC